jgi:hypothetical protein
MSGASLLQVFGLQVWACDKTLDEGRLVRQEGCVGRGNTAPGDVLSETGLQ